MATEAPPSYDSIVGKVDAGVKADPSFDGLQKVLANLSEAEKTTLASHADSGTLSLDAEQMKKFHEGFAQGLAQAQNHLEWNAEECATVCVKVGQDFLAVANKLSAISSQDGSQASKDLVTDFVALEQRYQTLLSLSRVSAVKVSQQADRFDTVIVPIATDKSISIDTKKAKIEDFIREAENLEKEADGIQAAFSKFLADMTTYTGRFDSWAQQKEGDLNKEIQQLGKDIADLKSQVANITTGMIVLGGASGALPAFAVGAVCAGPLIPIVIGVGLFFAVGTVAAIISLAFIRISLDAQIDGKVNLKETLEKQLKDIQQSRQDLNNLGKTLANDVAHVVGIINAAWKYCQDDAAQIKKWLEAGEKDTDVPLYMALELAEVDGIYSVVGKYLRKYADCLADTSKHDSK